MLRTPCGVFTLRPCTLTRVLMESNLECSSSTETSTDSGTLRAASRIGRKLKQNRSTLWESGQSIIGKYTVNREIFVLKIFHAIIFRVKIFSYASRPYENILTTKIFQ